MNESLMRKYRKEKGLRLIDLAERTGISPAWLWSLENGYEKGISQDVKTRVAKVLNSKVEILFKSSVQK